jgi:hypothetical protein
MDDKQRRLNLFKGSAAKDRETLRALSGVQEQLGMRYDALQKGVNHANTRRQNVDKIGVVEREKAFQAFMTDNAEQVKRGRKKVNAAARKLQSKQQLTQHGFQGLGTDMLTKAVASEFSVQMLSMQQIHDTMFKPDSGTQPVVCYSVGSLVEAFQGTTVTGVDALSETVTPHPTFRLLRAFALGGDMRRGPLEALMRCAGLYTEVKEGDKRPTVKDLGAALAKTVQSAAQPTLAMPGRYTSITVGQVVNAFADQLERSDFTLKAFLNNPNPDNEALRAAQNALHSAHEFSGVQDMLQWLGITFYMAARMRYMIKKEPVNIVPPDTKETRDNRFKMRRMLALPVVMVPTNDLSVPYKAIIPMPGTPAAHLMRTVFNVSTAGIPHVIVSRNGRERMVPMYGPTVAAAMGKHLAGKEDPSRLGEFMMKALKVFAPKPDAAASKRWLVHWCEFMHTFAGRTEAGLVLGRVGAMTARASAPAGVLKDHVVAKEKAVVNFGKMSGKAAEAGGEIAEQYRQQKGSTMGVFEYPRAGVRVGVTTSGKCGAGEIIATASGAAPRAMRRKVVKDSTGRVTGYQCVPASALNVANTVRAADRRAQQEVSANAVREASSAGFALTTSKKPPADKHSLTDRIQAWSLLQDPYDKNELAGIAKATAEVYAGTVGARNNLFRVAAERYRRKGKEEGRNLGAYVREMRMKEYIEATGQKVEGRASGVQLDPEVKPSADAADAGAATAGNVAAFRVPEKGSPVAGNEADFGAPEKGAAAGSETNPGRPGVPPPSAAADPSGATVAPTVLSGAAPLEGGGQGGGRSRGRGKQAGETRGFKRGRPDDPPVSQVSGEGDPPPQQDSPPKRVAGGAQ